MNKRMRHAHSDSIMGAQFQSESAHKEFDKTANLAEGQKMLSQREKSLVLPASQPGTLTSPKSIAFTLGRAVVTSKSGTAMVSPTHQTGSSAGTMPVKQFNPI